MTTAQTASVVAAFLSCVAAIVLLNTSQPQQAPAQPQQAPAWSIADWNEFSRLRVVTETQRRLLDTYRQRDFPNFTAFDNNGRPLPYARLYTYSAGTLIPAETWNSSVVGDIPNTNPVLADSYGRMYVKLSHGKYRFILIGPDGTQLFDQDNVEIP